MCLRSEALSEQFIPGHLDDPSLCLLDRQKELRVLLGRPTVGTSGCSGQGRSGQVGPNLGTPQIRFRVDVDGDLKSPIRNVKQADDHRGLFGAERGREETERMS